MIDLTSTTFAAGAVAGLGIGALTAGWWVTVRAHSRAQAQLLESRERAQRADTVAATLHERIEQQQSELGQLRQALTESQAGRTRAETRMEALSRSVEDQQSLLANARQELHESFVGPRRYSGHNRNRNRPPSSTPSTSRTVSLIGRGRRSGSRTHLLWDRGVPSCWSPPAATC